MVIQGIESIYVLYIKELSLGTERRFACHMYVVNSYEEHSYSAFLPTVNKYIHVSQFVVYDEGLSGCSEFLI